jgi:hypothetical protein
MSRMANQELTIVPESPHMVEEQCAVSFAFGVAVVGALIAAAATLGASHRIGTPLLLRFVMTGWGIAPFVVLAVGNVLSAAWREPTRHRLQTATYTVTVIASAVYVYAAFATARPPVAAFVLIPPIATAFAIVFLLRPTGLHDRPGVRQPDREG